MLNHFLDYLISKKTDAIINDITRHQRNKNRHYIASQPQLVVQHAVSVVQVSAGVLVYSTVLQYIVARYYYIS